MIFRSFEFFLLSDIVDLKFWGPQVLVQINCNVGSVGSEIYRLISERLSDFYTNFPKVISVLFCRINKNFLFKESQTWIEFWKFMNWNFYSVLPNNKKYFHTIKEAK